MLFNHIERKISKKISKDEMSKYVISYYYLCFFFEMIGARKINVSLHPYKNTTFLRIRHFPSTALRLDGQKNFAQSLTQKYFHGRWSNLSNISFFIIGVLLYLYSTKFIPRSI